MTTDIAMLMFFVIQVIFNISIMQKTDRIEDYQSNLIMQNKFEIDFMREQFIKMINDKEQ